MEPIQITLNPPITEHCRNCGYEASRSFYSMRVKCPKCGSEKMKKGDRRISDLLSASKESGNFNICDPSDVQYRYSFYNIPNKYRLSFVVEQDIDDSDIFELIEDLKAAIDSYLYYGNKKEFDKFYEMVMSEEFRDKYEKDSLTNKKIRLESDLYRFYTENPTNDSNAL